MALNKRLVEITEADLIALKDNGVMEGVTIEYKRNMIETADDKKREFRADVTSFANASGGDLILGIEEADGVPIDICGIDVPNLDNALITLSNILNDNIQPRVPRIQTHIVNLANTKSCIVVRIPKSLSQPHAVIQNRFMQFFSRGFAGKVQLDIPQIKESFLLADAVGERIRQFRIERVGQIISENTPIPMGKKPKRIYHLVPLSAFETRTAYSTNQLLEALRQIRIDDAFGSDTRFNFDGVLRSDVDPFRPQSAEFPADTSYAQFYTNGIIEAVNGWGMVSGNIPSLGSIGGIQYDVRIKKPIPEFLKMMSLLNIEPPFFLMVSMIGVKGLGFQYDRNDGHNPYKIDRDNLLFPEVLIEDLTTPAEVIIKDISDKLWQAGGFQRSGSYNEDGLWTNPLR